MHGAKPTRTPSPLSQAAPDKVGLHHLGVAPRDCNCHSPIDALHDLLRCHHNLEARALLDEVPDQSQGLRAQASRRVDSKGEELRPNLISQHTVHPRLLSLSRLQHCLCILSTLLYM